MENFLLKIFMLGAAKFLLIVHLQQYRKIALGLILDQLLQMRLVAGRRKTLHALGGFQTGGGRD